MPSTRARTAGGASSKPTKRPKTLPRLLNLLYSRGPVAVHPPPPRKRLLLVLVLLMLELLLVMREVDGLVFDEGSLGGKYLHASSGLDGSLDELLEKHSAVVHVPDMGWKIAERPGS